MAILEENTLVPAFQAHTFVDLFVARVAETPQATALVCGNKSLTFVDLNERANQVAGYLISLGVRPEMPVGVCVPRSLDMVVAILGVIKAGGAYVPLDPAYPAERISFILNDARAAIVITHSSLMDLFQSQPIRPVYMDLDGEEIARYPVNDPATLLQPEHLVYVIYTSGSTGKPKGVMITHVNLVSFVQVACSMLNVDAHDVYLQSATIAYALSVRQLMIPLVVGAKVVIASASEIGDPLELFNLIKCQNITLMDMVPSFWRSCIQRISDLPQAEQNSLLDNSLRRVVSIGEALMADLPRDWYDRFGTRVQLVNIFGQTETTGIVAAYPIPSDLPSGYGIVPIGRSAAQTRIYQLDSNLQEVPYGEAGELCISNPCVARGYLNRPELTDEKFIPNPFNDGLSDRLYRTGDLARLNVDGNIEFLGRGDQQVKIRGQRLELGEVETVLREHPDVHNCVVAARGANPDEKYLAAYVVPVVGASVTVSVIKEFMRKRLPEYMVPPAIVFLKSLPLNHNGKIDRLALPDPKDAGGIGQIAAAEYVAPRNEIEKTITMIWQDVIKLKQVGIHDNFFDIGGHSLMAVRILTRIERELGVRLPLTSLLHAPTAAQLAELVDHREDEARNWSPLVPIRTTGNRTPFFGIHAVGGGVLFWRDIVNHLPDDQPFYALQSQGVDGIRPALNDFEVMANLYIREIRKIQPHGPYYIGGFSLGGEIAFEIAQQLHREGEHVALLAMLDTRNPSSAVRPTQVVNGVVQPVLGPVAFDSPKDIFIRKLHGHWRVLSGMSLGRAVIYSAKLIGFQVRLVLVSGIAALYRKFGKRLPDQLLLQYLRANHRAALRNYVPAVYPGRITIFRANESIESDPLDSPMGWKPLAGGGLDAYYFDTPHEMIKPEYAEMIAKKLNECIQLAQANIS